MGPFRFALVVLALGLLLGASTAALGAPSPPPPKRTDTPRPTTKRPKQQITVVLLVEKSEARARNTLVQSIRSQLSDTAVKLDLQSVDRFAAELSRQLAIARKAATRSRSRVVIWFSLTRAEPLYLYFVEPKGTRLIMRNFGEMDADERAEAAALVVRSSVLAFLRVSPWGGR